MGRLPALLPRGHVGHGSDPGLWVIGTAPARAGRERRISMGIFDKLKNSAVNTVAAAAASMGNQRETFTFAALPESLESSRRCRRPPWRRPSRRGADGAGAVRLCRRPRSAWKMLNCCGGAAAERAGDLFLNDRFRDGKTYLPFTYFAGATPDNNPALLLHPGPSPPWSRAI